MTTQEIIDNATRDICSVSVAPAAKSKVREIIARALEQQTKELEIADARWKRAEEHHREFHESDTEVCLK